jgi:hypothetical protein
VSLVTESGVNCEEAAFSLYLRFDPTEGAGSAQTMTFIRIRTQAASALRNVTCSLTMLWSLSLSLRRLSEASAVTCDVQACMCSLESIHVDLRSLGLLITFNHSVLRRTEQHPSKYATNLHNTITQTYHHGECQHAYCRLRYGQQCTTTR